MSRQRGFAAIEWTIGIGLIVLPVAVLVASLPPWFERITTAREMAQEAARAAVLADDWATGVDRANSVARQIGRNGGISDSAWCEFGGDCVWLLVDGAPTGTLARGAEITVTVNVVIPGVTVPFVGSVAAVSWSTSHSERVDDYRSIP